FLRFSFTTLQVTIIGFSSETFGIGESFSFIVPHKWVGLSTGISFSNFPLYTIPHSNFNFPCNLDPFENSPSKVEPSGYFNVPLPCHFTMFQFPVYSDPSKYKNVPSP